LLGVNNLVSLKEQKAISTLLIIIIVLSAVFVAAVATVIYFWIIPGEPITKEFEYSDFTAVDVSSAFHAVIIQDTEYRAIITADEKIFNKINVTKTGNTLSIRTEPNTITALAPTAVIRMPNLTKLALSGASIGKISFFNSSCSLSIELSGASILKMEDINVGDVDIELSGASTLTAEALQSISSGNNLVSIVEGASNLDLANFPVTNGDLFLSGASQATVNLDGTLDAKVSGASSLIYIGEPTMGNIDISDTSTIIRK
jgi:hypothetical protein